MLIAASLDMGASGVGLLATTVATPVVLALEIAVLSCGVIGMAGKLFSRRIHVKAKKHDEIRVLAESKINSIKNLISKAIEDGEISQKEFKLVMDELERFNCLKKSRQISV